MIPATSELYWFLLQPSSLVMALFFLSLLVSLFGLYRAGRSLLFVSVALAILPALLPVREVLATPLEGYVPRTGALPAQADGIIVLGGAVDWRVTAARGQLSLDESGERMIAGAALARRYPEARLVFTGVFGDTLAGEFTAGGAPQALFFGPEYARSRVIYLGQARSTYEDALLSLETLRPQAGETWLLVTSAMHMPRALGVFQTLGWQVVPYPVDYRTTGRLEFRPSLDILGALVALDPVVREWGALVIYQLAGRTESLFPRLN